MKKQDELCHVFSNEIFSKRLNARGLLRNAVFSATTVLALVFSMTGCCETYPQDDDVETETWSIDSDFQGEVDATATPFQIPVPLEDGRYILENPYGGWEDEGIVLISSGSYLEVDGFEIEADISSKWKDTCRTTIHVHGEWIGDTWRVWTSDDAWYCSDEYTEWLDSWRNNAQWDVNTGLGFKPDSLSWRTLFGYVRSI